MRSLLTAAAALLVLSAPAFAQAQGGAQVQVPGGTPSGPLPMTQPGAGATSTNQRPSTAHGAMGATGAQSSSNPSGGTSLSQVPTDLPAGRPGAMANPQGMTGQPGMGQPGMGQPGMDQQGMGTRSLTMQEDQVRDLLRSQGYSNIQGVTRDGDSFRAQVQRNGRQATVTVDAYTGTIRNQAAGR